MLMFMQYYIIQVSQLAYANKLLHKVGFTANVNMITG